VTKPTTSQLKLHVEKSADESTGVALFPAMDKLCKSFTHVSGHPLRFTDAGQRRPSGLGRKIFDIAPAHTDAVGRLVLDERVVEDRGIEPASFEQVEQLADSIAGLLTELQRTRIALASREAELATGIPVAARPNEAEHLAQRLQAVLQAGAESLGCQAAGLYLLDEATTELKLRSQYGLPEERLMESARPLRGAIADLEALTGHAVALEDADLFSHWNVPESCAAAVCVPVSSPTTELGTLWVFADRPRQFTDNDTNLVEILAGRLAAELEREVLLAEGTSARKADMQLDAAAQQLENQLPHVAPLIDGWDVAGWTAQADRIGGDFHDWFILDGGQLALAVGDAQLQAMGAAMTANTVSTAVKSHRRYPHEANEMLARVNHTLWTAGAGDQIASLFYGSIEPRNGRMSFATAGEVDAVILRPYGFDALSSDDGPLGRDPEAQYQRQTQLLARGDTLLIMSHGVRATRDRRGRTITPEKIIAWLKKQQPQTSEEMVLSIRRLLHKHDVSGLSNDCTLLVAHRWQ